MAIFDDFTGTNLGPLNAAKWTVDQGNWLIFSNTANAQDAAFPNLARYTGEAAPSANHYAQIVETNAAGGGPAVRLDSSKNGYFARTFWDGSVSIQRLDAGSATEIAISSTGVFALGDTVRLEADGSTIRAKVNGGQVASATDSTHSTQTSVGMIEVGANGALQDNFEGGALGGEGGGISWLPRHSTIRGESGATMLPGGMTPPHRPG
jgi:hypothetical protein